MYTFIMTGTMLFVNEVGGFEGSKFYTQGVGMTNVVHCNGKNKSVIKRLFLFPDIALRLYYLLANSRFFRIFTNFYF